MAQVMNLSSGLMRVAGVSAVALVLAACSALPTPPTQHTRYDLGVTDTTVPMATAAAPLVAPPPLVLAEVQTPAGADNSTAMLYRLGYADSQEQRAYQLIFNRRFTEESQAWLDELRDEAYIQIEPN